MKKNNSNECMWEEYAAPAIQITDLRISNFLCVNSKGETTEKYEEGEEYGEDW